MIIPKSKPLVVPMPKEHNYRIEEGCYSGVINRVVRSQRQNGKDTLRIVFALNVPGKENFLNFAKAEFNLNLEHGSELRDALVSVLGNEAVAALSGKEINFQTLVGKPADVQVEHIITSKTENYDYPYVQVCDIKPAGTWVAAKPAETGKVKN